LPLGRVFAFTCMLVRLFSYNLLEF
jgi:hypothetical protein